MSEKQADAPVMTADQVMAYIDEVFPQVHHGGRIFDIESVGWRSARVRMAHHERSIRPGGTISGPAMFTLADFGLYVALLGNVGPIAQAVTTNLNINFLSLPAPADMIGEVKLLKLGKRLAVGEVSLFSDGVSEIVAHATGTYSIPPPNSR